MLSYPLPEGITNYGIATLVYGKRTVEHSRNLSYEMPDYETVEKEMSSRKNMTPMVLWNRYSKQCRDRGVKFYSYRQFCENYAKWCEENKETLHFNAVIGQKMEVDFAGKAFQMVDHLTGEVMTIVVFVAVLPYSQHIYAEGMVSTKEPQWIAVNNNALQYFGGVPALVVCDNCKQAVIANKDWIDPELNSDYAEWAEYNHTVILPAKVKKPKYKSSVENAVGILEKGFFHDMEEMYRSPKFLELDPLTAIANLVQPEYQKKMNKRIQSRLRSAHLRGCPQELSNCVDSGDREYLPRGITGTLSILDFIDAGMNVCILGPSDSGKSYLAKAIGIVACNTYKVESPPHCETLLEEMVALKAADYSKYQKRMKKTCGAALLILDDFLLHTITDEREVKVLFEILEKRSEINLSTIICSRREPTSWSSMILNNEVSSNAIMKRATRHYTVVIKPLNNG